MHNHIIQRSARRYKRALRVRKHVRGSAEAPRLSVFKSNLHLSAQIIDDDKGETLVGLGTMSKELRKGKKPLKKSKAAAREIGTKLAQMAKEKNIEKVIFDRGRYKYHGVIAELASAAREGGLKF